MICAVIAESRGGFREENTSGQVPADLSQSSSNASDYASAGKTIRDIRFRVG
jgi:hypothetical protein